MSSKSWAGTREAFAQSAAWFVRTSVEVQGRWDQVGLGEWTVRDLVGHTSRALLTVETYLSQEAAAVEVTSPVEYFRLVLCSTGDPAAVAQRGRDAGAALGADAAEAVAGIADRVLARVSAAEGDSLVATPVGGMRLIDYLPTRTFELTVHTCDLAAALGQVVEVPEAAAVESLHLLGELAIRAGRAAPLLLAATGRGSLPAGFTVL
jgi:hypothetical protein